jgi:hypothetical protein
MSDDSQSSIFRKESLERLSSPEQLDQLMQVVSPRSWLPLATLGCLLGLALAWSVLGRIPITASGQGILVHPSDGSQDLVSLSYFNAAEASRIQPGMEIVVVANDAAEPLTGIPARVKSVSQPSLITLEAVRQAQAADAPLIKQDSVEVLAEFSRANTLAPGTPITTRITLDEKPPIAFVLPLREEVD